MEWIGRIFLVFFLLIGVISSCRMVVFWLLKPDDPLERDIVVTLSGHMPQAEYLLREAAEQIQWMPGKKARRLICVDGGMDEETREICEYLKREIPFLEICTPGELEGQF